ncbi:MAG: heme exporter protein CcmD [Rhodospirillaceae bacterium]|nr:heme exporter protein CcmD [Rhodospirillaceae bacterium]|tara:strand:+ start:2404 stop:2610 length:207 start_codon:yes stop_codon:yes gene_type:complete
MQMLSEFLAMGGYGSFIWAAYGTAAIVLLGLLYLSLRELRATGAEIAALEANSPRRRRMDDEDGDEIK